MKIVQGNLQLGRYRGVPLLFHWSLPLGLVFMMRFRWAPGAWLGFLLLVMIHEAGHAFLVKRYGMTVTAVQLHGLGGECRYIGGATPRQSAVIAWGGVLGQALLLPVGVALAYLGRGLFVEHLGWALTWINLHLMALNLIPIAPLDGAEAWKLPRMWWQRRKRRRARRQQIAQQQAAVEQARAQEQHSAEVMASLEAIDPEGHAPLPEEVQQVLAQAMQRAHELAGDRESS